LLTFYSCFLSLAETRNIEELICQLLPLQHWNIVTWSVT
jgi:hypothetical protein